MQSNEITHPFDWITFLLVSKPGNPTQLIVDRSHFNTQQLVSQHAVINLLFSAPSSNTALCKTNKRLIFLMSLLSSSSCTCKISVWVINTDIYIINCRLNQALKFTANCENLLGFFQGVFARTCRFWCWSQHVDASESMRTSMRTSSWVLAEYGTLWT